MTLKRKKRSQAIVLYVDGDQAVACSYRKRGRGAKLRAEGHSRLGQQINQIEPARLVDDLGGVFRQLSPTTNDCIIMEGTILESTKNGLVVIIKSLSLGLIESQIVVII